MYTIEDKRIVVFGGTGFVGRELATRLARGGAYVTLVARHPERCREPMVLPRVTAVAGDVRDAAFVGRVLADKDAAVNLVGVMNVPARLMRALHVDWPARLAESGAGLARIVHVSAAGADAAGPSRYLRTKAEGEERIRRARAAWTIVAPSVIFGPGDGLFTRFARLLRLVPAAMPVVRPRARFTPVYVGDVAEALVRLLARPEFAGERLALGGPETWTLREIFAYTRRVIGVRRLLINLPDPLARLEAALFGLLPGKLLTLDQYRSLLADSVADTEALARLGIEATAVDALVPTYLGGARRQEELDRFRHRATGAPTATP